MKVCDLSDGDREILAWHYPLWMSRNCPDWMVENYPRMMCEYRPEWMAEHYPGKIKLFLDPWMLEQRNDVPPNVIQYLKIREGKKCTT